MSGRFDQRREARFLRSLSLLLALVLPGGFVFGEIVSHWRLDEGLENEASADFDGYLVGDAFVDFSDVVPEEDGTGPSQEFAAEFFGAGSFIQTDFPGIEGNNARSIACWIKTSATAADILGFGIPTNSLKWHFRVNNSAANGLVGAIRTEFQGGQNVGTTIVNDGRWHHVAAVFPEGATTGSQIVHYVDGVVQGRTGNGVPPITTDISDPFYNTTIGLTRQGAASNRWFTGQIADVRIYDHGLTAQNIVEVMDDEELTEPVECTGLELSCETSEEDGTLTASLTLAPEDCLCETVEISVNGEARGTEVVVDGQVTLALDRVCGGFPGEEAELTLTCSNTEVSASCNFSCPEHEGLIVHWPLDEGDGETFAEIQNGFDGFLDPLSTVEWVDGPPAQEFAVEFSGLDSWISTDYPGIGGAAPRTIAAWIRTTMPDNLNTGIIAWGQDAATRKWHIRLNSNAANGTQGALRIEVNGGYTIGTTVLNDGEWHHIAIVAPERTNDTSDLLHYVDGQLEEKSGTLEALVNTNVDLDAGALALEIGRRVNGNGTANYYPGAVADLRVYDEALDQDALLEIVSGGECFARRSLSSSRFVPGETVGVSVAVVNATTLVETIPDGWTVSDNPDGGVIAGSTIRFDLAENGSVAYELSVPADACGPAQISGLVSGEGCENEVFGSPLSCLVGCEDLQESGGVHAFLVLGPIDAGRNTDASGRCDDEGPDGSLETLDYLLGADGAGEAELAAAYGDEIAPDFGGDAGGVGVAIAPNPEINPRRDEGILTVWSADADANGRVSFNDVDNLGDPLDDYIIYSLVYLENETDDEFPVILEVGSDDAIKVIVNGETVWVNPVCRGMPAYGSGDRVALDGIVNPALRPGSNTVLIAVVERGGGNGVSLVVRDEFDNPLIDGSVIACLRPGEGSSREICDNGQDDDGDGLVDCADDDCTDCGAAFVRGDADSSGAINITDGIFVLNFLFLGGPAPSCGDAADADDSGSLNITDGIFILNFLFLGGEGPPAPFEACGSDPSDDGLDCTVSVCP